MAAAGHSHVIKAGPQKVKFKKRRGPKLPETRDDWLKGRRLFVVLEMASLETAKTKHGYELLNSAEHSRLLHRHDREVAMYRPDILHQALLTLLDSPLNKAGLVKIFIHTQRNVLIDVNPRLRVPRTYDRFAGLMVQLLYQKRIRSTKGAQKLLTIVKNPVTRYLPPGAPVFSTSVKGDLVDVHQFVSGLYGASGKVTIPRGVGSEKTAKEEKSDTDMDGEEFVGDSSSNGEETKVVAEKEMDGISVLGKESPVVFVFGAHPHGPVDVDYTENTLAISQYPLSSGAAISRVLSAFERAWGVL